MGTSPETPAARASRLKDWWNGLSADQRRREIRAGHARLRLPEAQREAKTRNQRKAERRKARGKR